MPHHAEPIRSNRDVPQMAIHVRRCALAALLTLFLGSSPALAVPMGAVGEADTLRFAVAAFLEHLLGTELFLLDQLDEIGTYIDPDGAPTQQTAPPPAGPAPARALGT